MKITIDNRDTENIHIDTYEMLKGDSAAESEIKNYNEQNKTDLNYDDFNWTYDHEQIVKDFATESIGVLGGEVNRNIIKSIKYVSSTSPRFYNYTTDSYVMDVDVNSKALLQYIKENKIEIIFSKYSCEYNENLQNNVYHAALCHLLDHALTTDDYNMTMWEKENEVYYENTIMVLIKKS